MTNCLVFDWETTGLNPYLGDRGFAVAFGFSDDIWNQGEKAINYVQFPVDPFTRTVDYGKFSDKLAWIDFRGYMSEPETPKCGHNIKFDILMSEMADVKWCGLIHDTMIAARSCNTLEMKYGLKYLAKRYQSIPDDDEKDLRKYIQSLRLKAKGLGFKVAKDEKDNTAADYWIEAAIGQNKGFVETYCRRDVLRTAYLWKFYEAGMKDLNVRHTYDKEMALLGEIILPMMRRGVAVDSEKIREVIKECEQKSKALLMDLQVDSEIENPGSSKQLQELFIREGIHVEERTPPSKTYPMGQISTSSKTLKKYSFQHPVLKRIIEYNGWLDGLTYFIGYRDHVDSDGIIHGSFNQATTKTFRLSATEPNLQNIPNAETSGGEFVVDGRCVFIPRPKHVWVSIDYSQLELRIFASRAKISKLLRVFKEGGDPHDETRKSVPVLAEKPSKQGRKIAKNTNFTILFCGGPKVLLERYGIPIDEGKTIFNQYHNTYPEIREYQTLTANKGRTDGFILNAFNRRLNVDPNYAYRATSYDIQSSAADLIKNGMFACAEWIRKEKLPIWMVLQVHDELVFEIPESDYSPDLVRELMALMENHWGVFKVDTPTEASLTTTHWGEKEVIDVSTF